MQFHEGIKTSCLVHALTVSSSMVSCLTVPQPDSVFFYLLRGTHSYLHSMTSLRDSGAGRGTPWTRVLASRKKIFLKSSVGSF